tara:strand:- start:856 stop:963 length:108 start_codon:yes stop_codon:yes gene_type:complete
MLGKIKKKYKNIFIRKIIGHLKKIGAKCPYFSIFI